MFLRIRQVAMITDEFHRTAIDIGDVLGLEGCYTDPAVDKYGLKNTIWPIGHQFVELVAPTRDGTAGGRYLARRGGPTGYIVCTQTDDLDATRARVEDAGIRIVNDINHPDSGHAGIQLHPADTGGCFWELDHISLDGGDGIGGPWPPAGEHWSSFVNTSRVAAVTAVEMQTNDPARTADIWSRVADLAVTADAEGRPCIELDDGVIRFVPDADGRGPGMAGIDVETTDPAAVMATARARAVAAGTDELMIGGLRIRLVKSAG